MGLAFLSLHTAGLELQDQILISVDVIGLPLVRRWHVVDPVAARLGGAAKALRDFILEHGEATVAGQFDPRRSVSGPGAAVRACPRN
jgi:hypothetical protein